MASGMYENLTCSNCSIVYASVSGFAEEKLTFGSEYLFIVEVYWSDGRTTYVKRTYDDFLRFHKAITEHFQQLSSEAKIANNVYIPKLEGKKYFQWYTRDLAEAREEELHRFLTEVLKGNPMIACNPLVVKFFEPRQTDPVPFREPPDGSEGDNSEDDDDGAETVIFERKIS